MEDPNIKLISHVQYYLCQSIYHSPFSSIEVTELKLSIEDLKMTGGEASINNYILHSISYNNSPTSVGGS